MKQNKEIDDRLRTEEKDELDAVVPPPDIVAFNEARSCADLFRLYQKGQLDIQPKFQRGIVWSNKEQALFVDSLIKQLPIPSICISLDIKTQKRLVIDGLQRLWTIIHFLNFEEEDWKLPKCRDIDPELSSQKVSYIASQKPMLFDKLENLTIPITVLRCNYDDPQHMAYLFQIFRRLNSGGSKLLNQEIRNCIYQGAFNDFLRRSAVSEKWLTFVQTTKEEVLKGRFGNEERILRFFAMLEEWQAYKGNLAQFLNTYMDKNKSCSEEKIYHFQEIFQETLEIANKLNIPPYIRKNKNLTEGILVGIGTYLSSLKHLSEQELNDKLSALLKSPPYTDDIREGMAHTVKVKERIKAAIHAWEN